MELLYLLVAVLVIYGWIKINPKLDANYETKERILWYNDPLDFYARRHIVLWKIT